MPLVFHHVKFWLLWLMGTLWISLGILLFHPLKKIYESSSTPKSFLPKPTLLKNALKLRKVYFWIAPYSSLQKDFAAPFGHFMLYGEKVHPSGDVFLNPPHQTPIHLKNMQGEATWKSQKKNDQHHLQFWGKKGNLCKKNLHFQEGLSCRLTSGKSFQNAQILKLQAKKAHLIFDQNLRLVLTEPKGSMSPFSFRSKQAIWSPKSLDCKGETVISGFFQ